MEFPRSCEEMGLVSEEVQNPTSRPVYEPGMGITEYPGRCIMVVDNGICSERGFGHPRGI